LLSFFQDLIVNNDPRMLKDIFAYFKRIHAR
jgi:hypothetical protein